MKADDVAALTAKAKELADQYVDAKAVSKRCSKRFVRVRVLIARVACDGMQPEQVNIPAKCREKLLARIRENQV